MSTLIEAALSYAARGWSVLPLAPRSKVPLAGTHGFKDATTDEFQIREWLREQPHANIGIATGHISGLWALDVDPRHGGERSLSDLRREVGDWVTLQAITGNAGRHYYFRLQPGSMVASGSGLRPGLDWRGDGGYVVAPPSVHPNGNRYEWELPGSPGVGTLDVAPPALLALVAAGARGGGHERRPAPGDDRIFGEGERHSALTSMAGRLRTQGMGALGILDALRAMNERQCRPPLPDKDLERIASSAAEWEPGTPIPGKRKARRDERTAAKAAEVRAAEDLDEEETDEAATRRLVARDGHRLRYCAELGRWYVWDGVIWRPDRTLMVEKIAREAARAHTVEVVSNDGDPKRVTKALSMEGRNHVMNSLKGAASEPALAVLPEDLDLEPDILATPSGWVDLRTGALLPPDPSKLITQVTSAPYDPTAACPRWDRFLGEVAIDRADLVEFLRRWVGYCLTGRTKEQVLVVAYGRGANGKGTLWDTLRNHVLGPQYACEAPPKLLLARDYDSHPTELMELYRRRLVTASEVPDESRWDESKLKRLTGEDKIKGRYMRADFIEFSPTHKIVAYFNERPEVRDTTQSFWRRMKLVPFDASFLGAAADDNLRDVLASEAKGILAWAVRGAVDWYAKGLATSRAVSDATQAYKGDEDPVGSWLLEYTIDCTATSFQTSASLYDDFERWCRKNSVESKDWSKKAFGKQLRIHGAVEARSESARGWSLSACRKAMSMTRLTDVSDGPENTSCQDAKESNELRNHDTYDVTARVSPSCVRMEAPTQGATSDASCVMDAAVELVDDNPHGISEPNF